MPNTVIAACKQCGKERVYSHHDIKRGRVTDLCQPCSIVAYNSTRSRQPKEAKQAYKKAWFQKNKRRVNLYYAGYREALRIEMVAAYGGRCVECGEADAIVLVLDHIDADAPKEMTGRKRLGGSLLYQRLKAQGWPKGNLQLLCHNCNFRKEYRRRKDAVRVRSAS